MRTQIAAANWKMNLTLKEGRSLIEGILRHPFDLRENHNVLIAVPFPYLIPLQEQLTAGRRIHLAAQNVSSKNNGAFTGEVSASMLKSMDVSYALVGHSERREHNYESNDELKEKIDRCLENDVKPVFCCGEPLGIREADTHNSYVETQIQESLFHLSDVQIQNFIIAYEPIWAIGTGKTASSQQAQDMHHHIRSVIEKKYGKEMADSISILYGGSVKAANASEIFGQPDVDGGLVGGASLVAEDFSAIINGLKK